MEQRLLEAGLAVLSTTGWDGLSLERVAEEAGLSRVTLWRQGVTKEALMDGLLERLADDYRTALWPVLTSEGSGAGRLKLALDAMCDVLDRHLGLLLTSDLVFHRAPVASVEPFGRLLRDGMADHSLRPVDDVDQMAETLFNTVCWAYVHLRGRYRWASRRARRRIFGLVLRGLVTETANPAGLGAPAPRR